MTPQAADVLQVWRFDDSVVRTHIIAGTKEEAAQVFDRVMGCDCLEELDDVTVEIYPISGSEEMPIDFDGAGNFVTKTADEWIEYYREPHFL